MPVSCVALSTSLDMLSSDSDLDFPRYDRVAIRSAPLATATTLEVKQNHGLEGGFRIFRDRARQQRLGERCESSPLISRCFKCFVLPSIFVFVPLCGARLGLGFTAFYWGASWRVRDLIACDTAGRATLSNCLDGTPASDGADVLLMSFLMAFDSIEVAWS